MDKIIFTNDGSWSSGQAQGHKFDNAGGVAFKYTSTTSNSNPTFQIDNVKIYVE